MNGDLNKADNSPAPPGGKLPDGPELLADIRELIDLARQNVAVAVNTELTLLYWRVGHRIRQEVLKEERAEYGKKIVVTLSRQLVADYGNGFSEKNLRRMIQFAAVFPEETVVTLSRTLSWSHFLALIPLDQPLQRDFYAQMCRIEGWSVRTLRKNIDSMLYERTAISKKPEDTARAELDSLRSEDRMTPDLVFKDPYFLDFLGLNDRYLEKDLEDAILREMEHFLLELGVGFTFVARQKRIQIDGDDFYLDLLFYNRRLNRLIVVDLKLGAFKAEYKGQMELYLRWLDRHERGPGEGTPLGIILCAGKKREQIELLELGNSGIHVAEYMTELPDEELLRKKLSDAIHISRRRLGNKEGEDCDD